MKPWCSAGSASTGSARRQSSAVVGSGRGHRDLRVALAFTARALVDPELGDRLREDYLGFQTLISQLLRSAQAAGELTPGVDPSAAAARFFALLDGLGTQVLIGNHSAMAARELASGAIAALFRDSRARSD
ncbi:TetR family transcriptional regulator C-terminal domain-containing protein [Actinoalloteichus hymeniacidonis]|uniref:Bacterial transcriptional repressor n=1 Tax=Actinoalloteichus hymeniacidonis TaxID=340345 RepID=A0AAC9MZA2_9PSEU|nr:TetR family transcriptional regulator C-terminal domain-containing protein [Actinoalloteichus hymeniacidonis]AOS65218.1 Bacterial transcriptional repressor [Actinoalloteichus hymeniacidonis]MBB5906702.1 hypothetical protein [Actinoalloteichus hymeniacidonis]